MRFVESFPAVGQTIARRIFVTGAVWLICLTSSLWCQDGPASKPVSSEEALSRYADAASFQNNGAFELAAEEWDRFLEKFPNDPLADKARHYAGVCHMQLKHFAKAASLFEQVVAKGPEFELAEEALLNLAWCQYSQGSEGQKDMYGKAAESFANLVKQFPQGKYADQALFFRGESLYAQDRKKEAAQAYAALLQQFQQSSLRRDAMYALGATLEELKQHEEAGKVYDQFLAAFADDPLVPEIRMRKAETVLQTGDPAAAEKMFAAVAEIEGFDAADHALLRQAYCAAARDDFLAAAQLYARLIERFPNSQYVAEATMSAGRSFYRAEKFQQAAEWFQKVIDQGGANTIEAAHWLCRIHLRNEAPDKVVELVDQLLANAQQSEFLTALKMDQADALYQLSEWREAAVDKYAALAADHPADPLAPQALYNAEFTCWELERYDDSLNYAKQFLDKFSNHELAADVRHVAAECHLKKKDYQAAEAAYRELLETAAQDSRRSAWSIRLALTLFLQQRYDDTVKLLEPLISGLEQATERAEAQFLAGAAQFHLGQLAKAEKLLADSVAASGAWRQADEALLYLSRTHFQQKQLDKAIASVRKLIADYGDSQLLDRAYYRLGEYSFEAGDFRSAVSAYETLLQRWPKSALVPYAQYGLGWAHLKEGNAAAAAESFSSLLKEHADHELAADTHFARAVARRQLEQYSQSLEDLAAYLKSDPPPEGRAQALYEQGLAQAAQKDYAAAAKTLEQLLTDDTFQTNRPNALYELAWAYQNQGNQDKAIAVFTRLIKEHGDHPLAAEAHWRVGESYFEKEQYDRAIEQYELAKEKATSDELAELAMHKLGWALFRKDDFADAAAAFREQLQKVPQGQLKADALFMVAECLFQDKKYEEALSAFREARQSKPSKTQMEVLTRLHAGKAAAELEQWDESLKWLDEIPERYGDSPYLAESLTARGWAKQNLKQFDDAMKDYEQAVELSRGEPGAHARFLMGEIQFEQKKYDEAIKNFLRVLFGFGDDQAPEEIQHWQAMAGYEAGRCAEVQIKQAKSAEQRRKWLADAKRYYQLVVDRYPDHRLASEAAKQIKQLR